MSFLLLFATLLTAPVAASQPSGGQPFEPEFILSTAAAVDGMGCCRPDGTAHAPVSFIFITSVRQAKPQYWGPQVRMKMFGFEGCTFPTEFLVPQTQGVIVSSEAAHVTSARFSTLIECPSNGFLGRSVARFWFDNKRDDSPCLQPCPGNCEPIGW